MTRPVATRDPKPSTFTAGFPRPVAPQRHRERPERERCDCGIGFVGNHWCEPGDGRSWTEEAGVWIAGVLTAVGILLAAWALVALALSAGPGR